MTEDNDEGFKAVYVSWQMILNLSDRMRTEGIPARVDRSYLGNTSGTTKAQFLSAAKSLRLLDGDLKPTDTFKHFVTEPDARPEITASLLHRYYGPALALGTNATQAQLEEVFREEYGISGSTVRKAIAFFLAAAKFAKIELSPHYTMPRTSTPTSRRRKPKASTEASSTLRAGDPMAELRTKYVTALLTKFEQADGEVDADLADRIERLIGFDDVSAANSSP